MTSHAIHGRPGKAIVCVTLAARRGHMGASERELGGSVVIELGAEPLRGRMAHSACRRESGRRVIRVCGLLEIG